jgi:hypothetical protein
MSHRQWLANNREQIHSWTDVASHIAQVIALVLAGIWTYKTFFESERPSLEAKPDVASELSWAAAPDPGFCDAQFKIEFQNNGKQSLDTAAIRVEGWLAEPREPSGGDPTLIDPDYLQKEGTPFFDETMSCQRVDRLGGRKPLA